jgi:hypothetical protein
MDFLDPRKFRRQKIRLVFGYFLVAIAIGLGTIVLVYGAYGYGINAKTGDIVQNGLLFVDSKPGGAEIYLNNKPIGQSTSARLVLPAKNYDLLLKKTEAKSISFDEYDANDYTKPPVPVVLPATLLTKSPTPETNLTEVEWSTDNNHVLLRHDYAGGNEYIILDRNDPAKSVNVNKALAVNPTQVAFKNKKPDQLYVYMQAGGTLQVADMNRPVLTDPIIKNIVAFKPYGSNIISYVTLANLPPGKAQARIWDNNKTYPLYAFNASDKYLLDIASYSGHTYYTAGSAVDGRVNVYRDPLNDIKNPTFGRAVPVMALRAGGAQKIAFSDNARFIALQGGQNFAVYDLETGDEYNYTLQDPLASPLEWMDGHRLIGSSKGNVLVMDYDSSNKQTLAPTSSPLGGFFSRDYNQMYTLAPTTGAPTISFERVDMRAGTDLPKSP